MAAIPLNLQSLWKERQELEEFKLRDVAYRVYESAFLGRSMDKKEQFVTWRPQVFDNGQTTGDSGGSRRMINLCRQIAGHHTAAFSRPPRVWNLAYSAGGQADADKKTQVIQGMLRRSRIKQQQPLQSFRLSVRGDAVMGLDWSKVEGDKFIAVRSYDPGDCYPDVDKEDMGGMHDLLVAQEVRREWAERTFGIRIKDANKRTVRMFTYWTPDGRYVQVEDQAITDDKFSYKHELGFLPWRWIYNSPIGFMGQSDIVEIPKIQELVSDALLLALDAARKRVDKSYWGKGIAGDVTPRPGEVVTFPNPQAEIHEFPTADPPEMLSGIMQMLQNFAQSMGGISPISMEGMARGSIVTGAAVRGQVEAIEARTETKRVSIEGAYAILGEYILRVLESQFPETELVVATDKGPVGMKGVDVKGWYTCEASYGGFEGLDSMARGRWALEGLGRIHDDRKAIAIAYPDEDVEAMVGRLHDFQVRSATITGQAQAAAQAAAQAGQGGGGAPPSPGQPPGGESGPTGGPPGMGQQGPQPQMMPGAQPPGMPQVAGAMGRGMVTLTELEQLINVVRDRLHGDVWAVREIAVAGQSATPEVMVEAKEDVGDVTAALAVKKAKVTAGIPNRDEPKVSLL